MSVSTPQTGFLILNALVVTLVVLSFLIVRRAPKGPTKLELRDEDELASERARDARPVDQKPRPKFTDPRLKKGPIPTGWSDYAPRNRRIYGGATTPEDETAPGRAPRDSSFRERPLNVLFNWNGHTWDAYEVLGIPAGASLEAARVAFERAAALADAETVPFLKAAFDSISDAFSR